MDLRISREKLFIGIAFLIGQRSTCSRANVGAVIVRDHRIISTGYCGSPSGARHCIDDGCIMGEDGGCSRTIHAEVNAIAFAAKHGVALADSIMYVTHGPCYNCAKVIINAGIEQVSFRIPYRDNRGTALLEYCGVRVVWLKDTDLD